tara:strand:+ start:147 stop:701 length:555 start_codon:yes stop_codon:yes gene_type:complete
MRKVCEVNITSLCKKILKYNDADWDFWTRRRGGFHEYSRSIPLKWCDNITWFDPKETNEFNKVTFFDDFYYYGNELDDINNTLDQQEGPAKLVNALFIRLFKGCYIREHVDNPRGNDNFFTKTKRYHIPIVTHPDVKMICKGEEYHIETGYAYELENTEMHGVQNSSPIDRIHLVIDRCPYLLS